jgi:hypothetical protein
MQQPRSRPSVIQSAVQSGQSERAIIGCTRRPAHDTAGEQVEQDGQVKPAVVGTDARYVADPDAVGCVRFESAIEHVRRYWQSVLGVRRAAETTLAPASQAILAHQPLDAFLADPKAPRLQV